MSTAETIFNVLAVTPSNMMYGRLSKTPGVYELPPLLLLLIGATTAGKLMDRASLDDVETVPEIQTKISVRIAYGKPIALRIIYNS